MADLTYICDKCGKEFESNIFLTSLSMFATDVNYSLCQDCRDIIADIIIDSVNIDENRPNLTYKDIVEEYGWKK